MLYSCTQQCPIDVGITDGSGSQTCATVCFLTMSLGSRQKLHNLQKQAKALGSMPLAQQKQPAESISGCRMCTDSYNAKLSPFP